jgi:hypothetical protein
MSKTKKSTDQTARTGSPNTAAMIGRRHDRLETLAASYFLAIDTLEVIESEIEEEIAEVRARGEKRRADASQRAEDILALIVDLGISRKELASRFGLDTSAGPLGQP